MTDGTDPEYTKLVTENIAVAKGFLDYGVEHGLTSPEDVRLTIAKRQQTAKALVEAGMSQRKTAKALGVSQKQIRRDIGRDAKSIKSDAKSISHPQGEPAKDLTAGLTRDSSLRSLFGKCDANGGAIYVEIGDYAVRARRRTCAAER